ncbi:glycosyltransferase family 8 protein [Ensifer adhaerens]|uniref:glycosyltransferase family 8 protein n=1 Tax=Ensifer adhaerens TaxID=106592 RepID=UPI000CF065CD|nr:glycosyltransferase family 8 protein [Ensifer adhaerens]
MLSTKTLHATLSAGRCIAGHDIKMIVACSIDRRFAELAGVMLYSLEENGGIPDAQIFILADGLLASDKDMLQACARRKLHFIDIEGDLLSRISRLRTTSYWSRATYARLYLPELLADRPCRMLYLDADTLIKKSLAALFELQLAGKAVAAVPYDDPARFNEPLARAAKTPYFNAGVLLVDIDAWNAQDYTARIAKLLQSRSFGFLDQDVLNLATEGNFVHLAGCWNAKKGWEDYSEASIVHFTHAKPNTVECEHPEKATFLEYRKQTPWGSARLITNRDRRVRTLLLSIRKKWHRLSAFAR